MSDRLNWKYDGRAWPNRETSRFVKADGMRWHVQVAGSGPVLLLLHGTGASTHSWRDLAPLLAEHFTVVALDLPGHGFTSTPPSSRMSLPGMAKSVNALLAELDVNPVAAAGHSAGAAILAHMSLRNLLTAQTIISLNGAFMPLRGVPGSIFSPIAKVLSRSSLVPWLFAWRASDRKVVEKLIVDTGSTIDREGLDFYVQLARSTGHVAAALSMMANWNLSDLPHALPALRADLILIAGANDKTISPEESRKVHRLVEGSELIILPALGHLAHEEEPAMVADLIVKAQKKSGAAPGKAAPSRPIN